ncbi:MAG: M18 family aminopeptidase, partial [Erysipelotrichaceae bacterium]|nr:M18 family aminopeptidase [Erysipelotrichaceae bacterium]
KDQKIRKGGKYCITRNDSSIIAFRIGRRLEDPALHMAASHTDCPGLKLKPQPLLKNRNGCSLNVEEYGGMLKRPWFDRPLSLAGRLLVEEENGIRTILYRDKEPFCIIPSMAPHLERGIEDKKIDAAKDLVPIVTLKQDFDFEEFLALKTGVAKERILGHDLYLYPLDKACVWGQDEEFISSHHIDNLECAYATLLAFIDSSHEDNISLYASFDNEEVGSLTRQGADSDFLDLILRRISADLGLDHMKLLEHAMLLSCDNAHGLHPNHPELYDPENAPKLNEGVVLKFNASQSYCTDGLSSALLKKLLKAQDIPYQVFANKTGIRGGSTLGNLSNAHVSILSADIGLAQWAMHSPIETAGSRDVSHLIHAVKAFYDSHLYIEDDCYSL